MCRSWGVLCGLLAAVDGSCPARGQAAGPTHVQPVLLSVQDESVYAPPQPPRRQEQVNLGGVSALVEVVYVDRYLFRGLDRNNLGGAQPESGGHLQLDASLRFDLDKMPHPFVGVFVNVFDNDPVSDFQEIRPYFGADWNLRPLLLSFGHNSYIYPDRDQINTSEVFVRLTFDDSWLFRIEKPLLSPYILAAYDYDLYEAWYFEAGIRHVHEFDEIGLTLTLDARVAFVSDNAQFAGPRGDDTGFHHYQVKLTAAYSLNNLFNVSKRWGEWSIVGFIAYTDAISDDLNADTRLWGGGGIRFAY